MKIQGLDLLNNHRDDLPPQYLHWIDKSHDMYIHNLSRDQQIRTEIYDSIQGIFDIYDLLITPTLASLSCRQSHRWKYDWTYTY